ncbi:MAG: hypothetical protein ACM3JI_01765 [Anaerolineae bacterium]
MSLTKEDKIRYLNILDEKGYLEYGKIIPKEEFLQLFGLDCIDDKRWTWMFVPLLCFLSDSGYLCTSANLEDGSLRILDISEMGDRNEKITKNYLRSMKRQEKRLLNVDVNALSHHENKRFLHDSNKFFFQLNNIKSLINDILKESE